MHHENVDICRYPLCPLGYGKNNILKCLLYSVCGFHSNNANENKSWPLKISVTLSFHETLMQFINIFCIDQTNLWFYIWDKRYHSVCVSVQWKMFKNTFQSGFLSILYSIGSKPLQIWDKKVRNGHIKRITDNDIQSLVLEIVGTNVSTTYITCPADPKKTLGIKLPFLVMIIKNLKKYFTFEVQVRAKA